MVRSEVIDSLSQLQKYCLAVVKKHFTFPEKWTMLYLLTNSNLQVVEVTIFTEKDCYFHKASWIISTDFAPFFDKKVAKSYLDEVERNKSTVSFHHFRQKQLTKYHNDAFHMYIPVSFMSIINKDY